MQLEEFAASLLAELPTVESERAWRLRGEDLPRVSEQLHARELVVLVGSHAYGHDYTVRASWVFASRRACGALGLAVLAQVLHGGPEQVRIHLDARHDALDEPPAEQPMLPEQLIVELPPELGPRAATELRVRSYEHVPRRLGRFPGPGWHVRDPDDYPYLALARLDGVPFGRRDEERALFGFGSLRGSLRMASLLLDAAQDDPTEEVLLEGEPGVRGVAPASHEVHLVRPGGFAWTSMLDADYRDSFRR